MQRRLGVDIGGTFTDFVLIDRQHGGVVVEKCLTTPQSPEQAIFTGIEQIEDRCASGRPLRAEVAHATTLITNAILEKKGAKVGLLTTRGFRDVLEMGNETRYYVYDLVQQFPPPLVPRALRLEVSERTLSDGSIVAPVRDDEIEERVRQLVDEGVTAIAVMYLHAYRNPANELRTKEAIRRVAPDMPVSLSHEVVSRPREFERLSTTAADAYVKPIASDYMRRLADRMRRSRRSDAVSIMLSNGGISPIATAAEHPIQLVESGPAAGVEAAQYYGRLLKLDRVLAFDMGGTTAKLCLIRNGKVTRTDNFEVARVNRFRRGSGYRLAVSVYDLLEIGAGGGSIARLDQIGLLSVGPESAGSEPGPACYGSGGTEPTVTDADLVIGFIDSGSFLGGTFALDASAAESAISSRLAKPLGLSTPEAAWGVFDMVTEKMAAAARLHLSEHGEDPTRCTLIASGGAGPVHAVALARRMNCPRVIVPPLPGVMSAFGLLAARPAFELSRAVRAPLSAQCGPRIDRDFLELERETIERSGMSADVSVERHAELCHVGQDAAVEVDGSGDWSDPQTLTRMEADFAESYSQLFGRRGDGKTLQVVSLRVVVARDNPALTPPRAPASPPPSRPSRPVRFGPDDVHESPVRSRHDLAPGDIVNGPVIIEERESTTVVWPGDRLCVDQSGALVIELGEAPGNPRQSAGNTTPMSRESQT